MKIKPSIIISFLSGRLYSQSAPTELFADMLEQLIGYAPQTIELPFIRKTCGEQILNQLPSELKTICATWEHSNDWRERIEKIDALFEGIEFKLLTHIKLDSVQ